MRKRYSQNILRIFRAKYRIEQNCTKEIYSCLMEALQLLSSLPVYTTIN